MRVNGWTLQGGNDKNNLLNHMRAKLMVEEWNPKHKIAFSNGVLDLTTNEFTPQLNREDFITVLLPYPYDPIAKCPTWEKFLREALKGDLKAIDLVQAFFKYSILPKAAKKSELEVCWDLYGQPGTGKGTVLDTLTNIIGAHNCGAFSTKTFSNDNALAALIDKPVSICRDASGHLEDVGQFNSLISNEPIQIKILYKNCFATTLNTFFVRAYNDFITAPSASQGLNRRIVAMAFTNQPSVKDSELGEKLETELSGIFNWAYSISQAEMKRRILWAGEVDAVAEASIERFLANNSAYVFLAEAYPNGGKVKIRDLYHAYSNWTNESGGLRVHQRLFTRLILGYGCYQEAKIHGLQLYVIPPMKDFDVVRHLGIRSKAPEKTIAVDLKNTPDLGEKEDLGEKQKIVIPPISPKENLDLPTISDLQGEKGEKGEKLSPKHSLDINNELSDNATDSRISPESSTKAVTQSPEQQIPQTPSPNPKGVITCQRLINGKIGTTVIRFEKQSLAKEWKELIYLVFGYSGVIAKIEKPTDKLKWKIIFDKFDKEAIDRLNKKDLSKSPPTRE
jgi:putative DNA primase/helicase